MILFGLCNFYRENSIKQQAFDNECGTLFIDINN